MSAMLHELRTLRTNVVFGATESRQHVTADVAETETIRTSIHHINQTVSLQISFP